MKRLKRGVLVAIEGIDGSGKSLLVNNLCKTLKKDLLNVRTTKQPGDSKLGLYVRKIVQNPEFTIDAKAESLLFAADRAQHRREIIAPALTQGALVISDRMNDSSLIYQGYGRGLDIAMIQSINNWIMDEIKADLTFYIRVTTDIARSRLRTRATLSKFDKESDLFFQKLIAGYEKIYSKRSDVIILNGILTPQALTIQTKKAILKWINTHQLIL